MTRDIIIKLMLTLAVLTSTTVLHAQNEEEEKTPEDMATEEANRLERLLKLEPHQTFFIDSILQHDMRAMHDEIEALRTSGTQEYTAYKQVQDRWVNQIDSSYRKILTEYQAIQKKLPSIRAHDHALSDINEQLARYSVATCSLIRLRITSGSRFL